MFDVALDCTLGFRYRGLRVHSGGTFGKLILLENWVSDFQLLIFVAAVPFFFHCFCSVPEKKNTCYHIPITDSENCLKSIQNVHQVLISSLTLIFHLQPALLGFLRP